MSDLLAVGDLHLGRVPTRIPSAITGPAGLRRLTPRAALERVVELALAEGVAAVLLAGDVVDDENASIESFAPLAAAVRRLAEAGIETIAVVGNHDHRALPRLARRIPGLVLLGAGGVWEQRVVRLGERPVARIVGWSFRGQHEDAPPLDHLPDAFRARRFGDGVEVPVVGLLHCDLDVAGSRYAPATRAALAAAGADAWLLGHVHAPASGPAGSPPIGYLGCAAPCDPGEPGARGAWLVDLDGHAPRLRHVPLAPVRYERRDVDLSGAADLAGLEDRLSAALVDAAAALAPELDGGTLAVGLRLRARGALAPGVAALVADAAARVRADGDLEAHGARLFLERVLDETTPAVDVAGLAHAADPRGALARTVLLLESAPPGDAELADVLADGRDRLGELARRLPFRSLPAPALDDDALRALLLRAGRDALELLAPAGSRP